ncbi:PREDICTED: NKG2D ligand 2-like [Elephantulus edwardii]|uniref:NKG2D ligand 2-like n=1 Tax=Elephantulus edwardii TaxID=28737 RepID=UPI0003F085EE|nr:PREDICTED: NKG2D ligand 2-like [Elephantulus edwardii]
MEHFGCTSSETDLFVLLLLGLEGPAKPQSLYNFTIIHKATPGQSWCEAQGQVDKEPFCHFDCGNNKVMNLSLLGMKMNATEQCERQTQTLRDTGVNLRQQVLDIKLDSVALQIFLLFDLETMKWPQVYPGARLMKEA